MEIQPKTRVQSSIRVRFGEHEAPLAMAKANGRQAPDPLLLGFAPLHRSAMGVALGVVLGAFIFLLTLLVVHRGLSIVHLGLVGQFFSGYTVTPTGAFVGLLWGFGVGFVLGWAFAWLRNLCIRIYLRAMRSQAEIEQTSDFLDHL
jgi:hypothetical protein